MAYEMRTFVGVLGLLFRFQSPDVRLKFSSAGFDKIIMGHVW